jgi:hypothetical protein
MLILALGLGCGAGDSTPAPDAASPATFGGSAMSRTGRYRVTVRPSDPEAAPNSIHDWIVRIERADGGAARPTHVSFNGGMPSHGHGFTTTPKVTRALGSGEFLVEGVKFHMPGAWELRVGITDPETRDEASFQISVAP